MISSSLRFLGVFALWREKSRLAGETWTEVHVSGRGGPFSIGELADLFLGKSGENFGRRGRFLARSTAIWRGGPSSPALLPEGEGNKCERAREGRGIAVSDVAPSCPSDSLGCQRDIRATPASRRATEKLSCDEHGSRSCSTVGSDP